MLTYNQLFLQPSWDSGIGQTLSKYVSTPFPPDRYNRSVFDPTWGPLWFRIMAVVDRFLDAALILLKTIVDLSHILLRTISIYYALKRGRLHIIDLINTIASAILSLTKMPFGYLPEVCRLKSFYGPINPLASDQGGVEVVKKLIESGQLKGNSHNLESFFHEKSLPNAWLALKREIMTENAAAISLLIKDGKIDPDMKFGEEPPLMLAIRYIKLTAARALLDAGANPNKFDDSNYAELAPLAGGTYPLIYSIHLNRIETTQLLLDYKADPNQVDNLGMTPLSYVLVNFFGEFSYVLAEKIIQAGGHFRETDIEELRLLIRKIDENELDYEAIDKMISDNNKRPTHAKNPFLLAVHYGSQINATLRICRSFLACQADLAKIRIDVRDSTVGILQPHLQNLSKPLISIISDYMV